MMRQRWPDGTSQLTIRALVAEPDPLVPFDFPRDSYLGALVAKYPEFESLYNADMADVSRQIKAQLFTPQRFAFKPDTSRSFRLTRWLGWKRIRAA